MASSNDEESAQELLRGKKRRLQRACDGCRRRKSDGSQRSGEKCTPCIEANLDCTYIATSVKRPPPKGYLDLATRLETSEALVRQLRAQLAQAHLASSSSPNSNSDAPSPNASASPPEAHTTDAPQPPDVPTAALCVMRATLQSLTAPPTSPHADDLLDLEIIKKFENLSSSGGALVNAVLDLKPDENSDPKASTELSRLSGEDSRIKFAGTWTSRRLRYWTWKNRGESKRHQHSLAFPAEDLMTDLIELYFARENIYLPVLHRPTFERGVAERLHLIDTGFAGTLLLVCAIASRWSTDPRVADAGLECGWEWFDQVNLAANRLLSQPTLYDLQHYCLAAQFLKTASMPQTWWTLVASLMRMQKDLGVHRSKARVEAPTVDRELHKRVFWVLVYLDRMASSVLGRTCSVRYFDYDIDLPLQVDDEYWDDHTHPFQQPAQTPSRMVFFNTLMRLSHILGFSLPLLYSLKKVRTTLSLDDAWEVQAIAELDSALNSWRDQIPDHLRWDPMREDPVFFNQSVMLHCAYYHLQIMIHRPFIPMLRHAPTALPSLTICTTAARACANVVDIQRRRQGDIARPLNVHVVFTAGVLLLLNILSGKRSGLLPDPTREMTHVHKCMESVRLCESRWQSAGMLWDILAELASVAQLPLPNVNTPAQPDWHDQLNAVYRSGAATSTDVPTDDSPLADAISFDSYDPNHQTFDNLPDYPVPLYAPYAPEPSSLFASGVGAASRIFDSSYSSFTPAPVAVRPEDLLVDNTYTDPTQASRELAAMMSSIDNDAMSVWTNAPTSLRVDDWGAYFSSFIDMVQGQSDEG
ncbi:fungal-specific transcription factor domain-containing protein [Mycena olivaceomarginata]|nr:fungal-specific transcription factor domain-containing protein [Mycena olivaceomarginata]